MRATKIGSPKHLGLRSNAGCKISFGPDRPGIPGLTWQPGRGFQVNSISCNAVISACDKVLWFPRIRGRWADGNDGLRSRYVKMCQENLVRMLPPNIWGGLACVFIECIDACFMFI